MTYALTRRISVCFTCSAGAPNDIMMLFKAKEAINEPVNCLVILRLPTEQFARILMHQIWNLQRGQINLDEQFVIIRLN